MPTETVNQEIGEGSETPKPFQSVAIGEKYVPEHGRGNLLRGNPGNSGRPPKECRDAWLELAQGKAFEYASQVLNDPESSPTEKIAAMNAALRFGLGTNDKMELAKPEDTIRALARALNSVELTDDQAEAIARAFQDELGLG